MDNPQQLSTIRTTTIAPVDLNALLYQLEKTLARASAAAGDRAKASHYDALANARQKPLKCICGITKRVGMPTTI